MAGKYGIKKVGDRSWNVHDYDAGKTHSTGYKTQRSAMDKAAMLNNPKAFETPKATGRRAALEERNRRLREQRGQK